MKNIDKYLIRHIHAELKKSPLYHFTNFINEEYGSVDYINIYVNIVNDYIDKYGLPYFNRNFPSTCHAHLDVYKESSYLFNIRQEYIDSLKDNPIFQPDVELPFFRYIDLTINISCSPALRALGGYVPEKSRYNGSGEGTVCIMMDIMAYCVDDIKNYIRYNIEHEFIHALEDFERQMKNKDDLRTKMIKNNYGEFLNYSNDEEELKKEISWLLYLTYDSEINAMVGEVNAELKQNRDVIKGKSDDRSILNLIKSTNVYNRIMTGFGYIDDLRNVFDSDVRNELLIYNNNKRKNNDIKTYGKLVKWFDNNLTKFENQLMRQAVKKACDIYCDDGKYRGVDKANAIDMLNKYGRKILK